MGEKESRRGHTGGVKRERMGTRWDTSRSGMTAGGSRYGGRVREGMADSIEAAPLPERRRVPAARTGSAAALRTSLFLTRARLPGLSPLTGIADGVERRMEQGRSLRRTDGEPSEAAMYASFRLVRHGCIALHCVPASRRGLFPGNASGDGCRT